MLQDSSSESEEETESEFDSESDWSSDSSYRPPPKRRRHTAEERLAISNKSVETETQ